MAKKKEMGCLGRWPILFSAVRLALVEQLAEAEDEGGDNHAVDGGNAPMEEVGDKGTEHHTGYCPHVDGGDLLGAVKIGTTMEKIAKDEDDAYGWKGTVEHIEPTAEVPVEPYSSEGAEDAADEHHSALGETEDVGESETCTVEGIVIGGPDVESEHEDGTVEEVEVEHDLEDIVAADVDAADGSEEEHQGVAEEEGDDGDEASYLAALCEAGEVGCGGASRHEAADNESCTTDDGEGAAALGELFNKGAVAALHGENHGDSTKDGHEGYCDVADYGEALDAEVGAGGHTDAGKGHEEVSLPGHMVGGDIESEELLGYGNGEHGKTDAEPSNLGKTDHGTGQPAALAPEAAVCQEVKGETTLSTYVTEGTGVGTQDGTTQQEGQDEPLEVEALGQGLSCPHAGREEGETQHDHKHTQRALASSAVHARRGVVVIDFLSFAHNCLYF